MPLYQFRDKTTGEVWEEMLTFSGREDKLKDENIEQVIGAPGIVSGVAVRNKVADGFRDVLKHIKKNNIDSNMNTH